MIGKIALRFALMLCCQALFVALMLGTTRAAMSPTHLNYFIQSDILSRQWSRPPAAEPEGGDPDEARRQQEQKIKYYVSEAKDALFHGTLMVVVAGTVFAAGWLIWAATQRWHGVVIPAALPIAWFGTFLVGTLATGAWLRWEVLAPAMRLLETETWCWVFLFFFAVFASSYWLFGTLVGAWNDVKPAVPLARHVP